MATRDFLNRALGAEEDSEVTTSAREELIEEPREKARKQKREEEEDTPTVVGGGGSSGGGDSGGGTRDRPEPSEPEEPDRAATEPSPEEQGGGGLSRQELVERFGPLDERQEQILNLARKARDRARGGFTRAEEEAQRAANVAFQQREEIRESEEAESGLRDVRNSLDDIIGSTRDTEEGTTFIFPAEEGEQADTISRQEAASRFEQGNVPEFIREAEPGAEFVALIPASARSRLLESEEEVTTAIEEQEEFQQGAGETVREITRTEQEFAESDPLGGVTTGAILEGAGPVEQAGIATQAATTAGFDILGAAGKNILEEFSGTEISGQDPEDVVERQVERARTGRAGPISGALSSLTQAPTAAIPSFLVGNAAAARGFQIAGRAAQGGGVLSTLAGRGGQAAIIGGGATLLEEETLGLIAGEGILQDVEEGRTSRAIGRGLRLGAGLPAAVGGARAVSPRPITGRPTTRARSGLVETGTGARGAGEAVTIGTRQPRILRPDILEFTRINARPIRTGQGRAVGRFTRQRFRGPEGGEFESTGFSDFGVFEAEAAPLDLRISGPFTQQFSVFGSAPRGATVTRDLPFTEAVGRAAESPFQRGGVEQFPDFPFTQSAQRTGVQIRTFGAGGDTTTRFGTRVKLAEVERPEGSIVESLTVGTSGRGEPFVGTGRTTTLQRDNILNVRRGTAETGREDGLDLQLLSETVTDIFGTGAEKTTTSAPSLTLTEEPLTDIGGGEAGGSQTGRQEQPEESEVVAAPTTEATGQFTDTAQVSGFTAATATSETTTEGRTRTGTGTRTETAPRSRPVSRSIEDLGLDVGPKVAPDVSQIAAPTQELGVRQQQRQVQRQRAATIPDLSFTAPRAATGGAALALPLGLGGKGRGLDIGTGRRTPQARGRERPLGIDIISANLAEFETGEATFPGESVVEEFKQRRASAGPLARLRAEEVETGEATRPAPATTGGQKIFDTGSLDDLF